MSQKGEFSLSSVNTLWHSPDVRALLGQLVLQSTLQSQAVCALGVAAYGLWGIFL